MEKRYQVFVSSTYKDLEMERQEVMHALLELDCIPSGMELFPASNDSQWALIKKVIDDCDYYILILAGRYGSCNPEGMSYTEMEYRYALSINKPTIAFLHKDPGNIASNKCESDKVGKERLAAFRTLVEKKLCKHWSTPQELGSVVSRSLVQLIKSTPAIGWVRADELPDKNATLELLRLRERVEQTEAELARTRITAPKGVEDLAQGKATQHLNFTLVSTDTNYSRTTHREGFDASWNEIFAAVGPRMIDEASEKDFKAGLNAFVEDNNHHDLSQEKRYKHSKLSDFKILDDDFQTIKVQLRALGLIAKSTKPRSVKDVGTYWSLTPYGDEMMTRLRAIKTPFAKELEEFLGTGPT